MFENIINFFKKIGKSEKRNNSSKDTAKERLHLVLMQDRANVSADFLDMMKQEIIEVIKKYIDVDENAIDVRLTNKSNEDGTNGAPALYANIPIVSIKEDAKRLDIKKSETKIEEAKEIVEKVEKEKQEEKEIKDKKKEKKDVIEEQKNIEDEKEENSKEEVVEDKVSDEISKEDKDKDEEENEESEVEEDKSEE